MTPEVLHRPTASVPPSYSSYWLLCTSLILHALLLVLSARPFNSPTNTPEPNPRVIKATLVYAKPLVAPSFTPQSAPRTKKILVPATAQSVAEKAMPSVVTAASSQLPAVTTSTPVEEKTVSFATTKAEVTNGSATLSVEKQVQLQLKSFNQQAIADMGATQAAHYRQQLTSPSLLNKPAISQLSEEEKFYKARQVRANCASTVNQGIAILAAITGGSIVCSKPPDVDIFIQDRLDKKALLPALSQK